MISESVAAPIAGGPASHRAGHVFGIDILRLLAAFMVAVFHFTWKNPNAAQLFPAGWVGVEIFFVISGFVIAGSAVGRTPFQFVRSRILRLYPAALVCLPLSVGCILASAGASADLGINVDLGVREVVSSLILIKGPFVASAYWTLPIEIAFYGLVWLVFVVGKKVTLLQLAAALIGWGGLFVVACLVLRLTTQGPALSLGYGTLNMTLLAHGTFFGLGLLIHDIRVAGLTRAKTALAVMAACLSGVAVVLRALNLTNLYASTPTPWLGIDPVSLAAAALVVFMALAVAGSALAIRFNPDLASRPGLERMIRLAGLMTFPFYLMHEAVGGFVLLMIDPLEMPAWADVGVALAVTTTAAAIVVKWLEPVVKTAMGKTIDAVAQRWLTRTVAKSSPA